jgi:hypothetical protein
VCRQRFDFGPFVASVARKDPEDDADEGDADFDLSLSLLPPERGIRPVTNVDGTRTGHLREEPAHG